ncbi:hypothetical protein F5Y16DRAFT_79503 [Xylariaceae sp. FL0255]|nr:hypothetical protein F5Y16DRAFT_79503 [Xylariaceae sp. FL0255]
MTAVLKLGLGALLPIVASQSTTIGQFLIPPQPGSTGDYTENPIYVVGETQTFEFTKPLQNFSIMFLQQNLHVGGALIGPSIFSVSEGSVTQFEWLVQLYQFNLTFSNVFYFLLSSNSDQQPSITAHYFNLTDADSASTTTSSTMSPSALPSSTSSSSNTISSTSGITPTAAPAHTQTSQLSTGAQAGIGVGAALVGLATIVIAIIFYRKSRRPHGQVDGQGGQPAMQDMLSYQNYYSQENYKAQTPVAELGDGPAEPVELPINEYRT